MMKSKDERKPAGNVGVETANDKGREFSAGNELITQRQSESPSARPMGALSRRKRRQKPVAKKTPSQKREQPVAKKPRQIMKERSGKRSQTKERETTLPKKKKLSVKEKDVAVKTSQQKKHHTSHKSQSKSKKNLAPNSTAPPADGTAISGQVQGGTKTAAVAPVKEKTVQVSIPNAPQQARKRFNRNQSAVAGRNGTTNRSPPGSLGGANGSRQSAAKKPDGIDWILTAATVLITVAWIVAAAYNVRLYAEVGSDDKEHRCAGDGGTGGEGGRKATSGKSNSGQSTQSTSPFKTDPERSTAITSPQTSQRQAASTPTATSTRAQHVVSPTASTAVTTTTTSSPRSTTPSPFRSLACPWNSQYSLENVQFETNTLTCKSNIMLVKKTVRFIFYKIYDEYEVSKSEEVRMNESENVWEFVNNETAVEEKLCFACVQKGVHMLLLVGNVALDYFPFENKVKRYSLNMVKDVDMKQVYLSTDRVDLIGLKDGSGKKRLIEVRLTYPSMVKERELQTENPVEPTSDYFIADPIYWANWTCWFGIVNVNGRLHVWTANNAGNNTKLELFTSKNIAGMIPSSVAITISEGHLYVVSGTAFRRIALEKKAFYADQFSVEELPDFTTECIKCSMIPIKSLRQVVACSGNKERIELVYCHKLYLDNLTIGVVNRSIGTGADHKFRVLPEERLHGAVQIIRFDWSHTLYMPTDGWNFTYLNRAMNQHKEAKDLLGKSFLLSEIV